jgi:hypothetical protein
MDLFVILRYCVSLNSTSIYVLYSYMTVNRARQLCSGIHKVHEEGVGQEIHGDELH